MYDKADSVIVSKWTMRLLGVGFFGMTLILCSEAGQAFLMRQWSWASLVSVFTVATATNACSLLILPRRLYPRIHSRWAARLIEEVAQ